MTIATGSRLGPYEIVASIGSGGMGEVYRALDTRLDRTVAIKVLSASMAITPESRERFHREARAISSLSHPHICALYDVGHHDGVDYLVMEYLEGKTVAERLARGAIPLDQLLRYGIQIAEALDKAHKAGIVHRDLKPANVLITKSGAKLLDFGLAKGGAAGESSSEGTTRIRSSLTEEGTILGTVPYMAPEQLEGNAADERTDIFALGILLYEMTTGKRAFDGQSRAGVIASILTSEPPPISRIQPSTPVALERLVRICMAKDPDERRQSAYDVATDLKWIAEGDPGTPVDLPRSLLRSRLSWGAAGLLVGLAIGAALMWSTKQERIVPAAIARLTMSFDPPVGLSSSVPLTISSDGSRLIYSSTRGNERVLYSRTLASTAPSLIPGTEGGFAPDISPDGRWIVFSSQGKLIKMSLDGTSRSVLDEDCGTTFGIRWYGDRIFYNKNFAAGIWSVPSAGGAPRLVAKADETKGIRALLWPDVLPGGKSILVTAWTGSEWDKAKIVMISMETGENRVIVDGGSFPRYVPTGHLLFGRAGSIFAAPFDLDRMQIAGSPVAVVNGVSSSVSRGDTHFAVSSSGTLAFVEGPPLSASRELLWVDRHGKEQVVVQTRRPYAFPNPSSDGRTVAVTLETASFSIWKLDIDRDSMTRLSFGGQESNSAWTPDGRLIFDSGRSGARNLYRTSADGSGGEERLTVSPQAQFLQAVSPDGRFVMFGQDSPRNGGDIWLLPLTGDRTARPFLSTPFDEQGKYFSSDGRWITYLSNESGKRELYVRPFPGPGGRWQISVDGAHGGVFSGNDREIFYRQNNRFYAVPIRTEPAFEAGKPQLLFERAYLPSWAMAPDRQRFLTMREGPPPVSNQIAIVLNWFEELKRRVPRT